MLPAILPTLATGAAFIMTSSVAPDGDNPMMRLMDTKYKDGTPVVKQIDLNNACNACKRKGLEKRCTHRVKQPEHFHSHTGNERMSLLMDKEAFQREIQNVEDTPAISNAFERDWLDAMFTRVYKLRRHQKHIFLSIDPAGGALAAQAFSLTHSLRGPTSPRHHPFRHPSPRSAKTLIDLTLIGKEQNLYVLVSTIFVDGQCVVCYSHRVVLESVVT